jgi:ethanolamine utilization microcompartment shell protein EutS
VEKRGIVGKVNEVANTQITITDSQNNTRFVDVDELTKFSNPVAKGAFGISDITKNATVGILGLYNKESRRILARFVDVITSPVVIQGGVSAVNNEDYTLSILTKEGKRMIVDVENLTRTYSYTQKGGLLRAGFSKIKENSNIIVVGVLNKTEENRLTATRIIFFPEIPSHPKVNSFLKTTQK